MKRFRLTFVLVCHTLCLTLAALRTSADEVKSDISRSDAPPARVLLKLAVEGIEELPQGREVSAMLRELPFVSTSAQPSEKWHLRLRRASAAELTSVESAGGPGKRGIALERADGIVSKTIVDGPALVPQMRRALETERRWWLLRSLQNRDPACPLQVALRLVPVEVETDDRGTVRKVLGDKEWKRNETGEIAASDGEYMMVELCNTGQEDVYVTILDLTGDGQIQPIFPHPHLQSATKIPADDRWHRIPHPYVFQLYMSGGLDIFKAIATREPVDFTPWLDYHYPSRGGGPVANSACALATAEVIVRIAGRAGP